MEVFHEAGGVPALMHQIASQLDLSVQTVGYDSLREQLARCPVKNGDVIRPLSRPLDVTGIVVLRGNLAATSVMRPMVGHGRKQFRGPARVFDSLEAALEGVRAGQLQKGEALVLRYEGPRGGPGCTDIFGLMGLVGAAGLSADCAVLTDGKASGFCEGFYVVQISPEAYVGGPLSLVKDGTGVLEPRGGAAAPDTFPNVGICKPNLFMDSLATKLATASCGCEKYSALLRGLDGSITSGLIFFAQKGQVLLRRSLH